MAPTERRAWILAGLFLVVFPVWLMLALPDQGIGTAHRLLRYDRPAAMWLAQIATIVAVITSVLYRRRPDGARVVADERDQVIERRAVIVAAYASLLTLIVECMIILIMVRRIRGEELIPLDLLVLTVLLACVIWVLAFTTTTIVSYRRGR